jgi:acyl-CoA hydrolase
MKSRKVSDSQITMTELVLPNHTNQLGNLLGGQLMHWIDICAALSASKHNGRICVTASVDKIDFHHHTNSAYLTFVSVDENGKPIKAVDALPETNEQKRRFNEALIRRENRLKNRANKK